MAMWILPIAIVFAVIGLIGWRAVRNWDTITATPVTEPEHSIPEAIEEHPYSLNPLIWVIAVAALFIMFVIFFYWASSV